MVVPYMADEVSPLVTTVAAPLEVFDHPVVEGNAPRFEMLRMTPTSEFADEVDGAAEWLGIPVEEILLAALGRALGRTRGEGEVAVDVVTGPVPTHRAVWLICSDAAPMGPTEMLQGAHTALAAAAGRAAIRCEVLLDVAAEATDSGSGHALGLHVHRAGGALHLDWRYDTNRFDAYSVEELAEQFPLALIEITSDAAAPL
ncbi:MAG: hypothetical protein WA944_05950 [Mycobacterium sp.]